jgi:hypothetical protein
VGVLADYTKEECYTAIKALGRATDQRPTHHQIRNECLRRRENEYRRDVYRERDLWRIQADNSINEYPGKTKAHKIMFICSEQAAESWIAGDRNEFVEDMLWNAQQIGIEHDGVDYEQVHPSEGASGGLINMVLNAN